MEDFCDFSLNFLCFSVTLPSTTANLLRLGKKKSILFVLLSTFRNSGFAEVTLRSEMKRKTSFPFAFHSTFRNIAVRDREITMLGIKNKSIYFVLLSTFRNFGFAELTQHSEKLK